MIYFFQKDKKFYEYNNTKYLRITSLNKWDSKTDPSLKPLFYYYGDSIMAYYNKKMSSVGLFIQKVFIFLDFHVVELPDRLSEDSYTNLPNYFNYVHQIIPLPDDRWIVFLNYDSYGTYCIVNNVSTKTDVSSFEFF